MKFANAKVADLDPVTRELVFGLWDKNAGTMHKGLFVSGEKTGTGKTYVLHAIANRLRAIGADAWLPQNWTELLLDLRDRMGQGSLSGILSDLTSHAYVFLDDIGAEKTSEWSQEMIYLVVNRCYELDKKLFITTNLSIEDFQKKYGERIVSRIMEMCEMYDMPGDDRRVA